MNFFNPVTTQTWTNGRHNVRCVKVIQETWDVRTFCFMAEQPVLFFFKPGQFVTLELEIEGEQIMRSYTISSSPSIPYSFSISVKRMPGGKVSSWLHDNMKVGDELDFKGPTGHIIYEGQGVFNIRGEKKTYKKIGCLAGGTGVTPCFQLMQHTDKNSEPLEISLLYANQTPDDILMKDQLDEFPSRGMKVT